MKRLLKFLRGYRLPAVLAPIFKLMEAVFELIIPLVVAKIINIGIPASDTPYIIKMGILIAVLGLLGLGFSSTCQYLAAKAALGYGTNLRHALYSHINGLSYSELDKIGASSLVTRLSSDINATQLAVAMFMRLVTRSPFIIIGSIVMAMTIDLKMSIIFILMSLLVSLVLFIVMTKSVPFYKRVQKNIDEVNLLTSENLDGARVIRAFGGESEENADFAATGRKVKNTSFRASLISALINPLTYAIINLSVIGILWWGGIEVNSGNLAAGDIVALVNYLSQILLSLVVLANLLVTFTKASASSARINEVFAMAPSVKENCSLALEKANTPYALEFDNVSFTYGANSLASLKNISFKVRSGEKLAIIGGTGSGKSTLISLLPRFYDITQGSILIDGHHLNDYPLKQLRDKLGLVPQKNSLFIGTIRDNMKWGNENATDEDILRALKISQSYEFVSALDDGLDSPVSVDGRNFSGGQKQRLCIARALVSDPEILILDDSLSALDFTTDLNLRRALSSEMQHCTIVQVSQRATSIMDADLILVLDNGAAAGLGKHGELMENCPLYREIVESQTK